MYLNQQIIIDSVDVHLGLAVSDDNPKIIVTPIMGSTNKVELCGGVCRLLLASYMSTFMIPIISAKKMKETKKIEA